MRIAPQTEGTRREADLATPVVVTSPPEVRAAYRTRLEAAFQFCLGDCHALNKACSAGCGRSAPEVP